MNTFIDKQINKGHDLCLCPQDLICGLNLMKPLPHIG